METRISKLMKDFRKANHLKQTDIAKMLGVPFQFVSSIERGTRPLPTRHAKILISNGVDRKRLIHSLLADMKDSLEKSLL